MNDMEIQREAIIEIVGTQYEGRAVNHKDLKLHQKIVMKHHKDNAYDSNAVLILTDDGRELGYLPKGYASLYAPAIDSGKYHFVVEVIKAEYDTERPILMVKITSDFNNISEEDVENDILLFVQNIVNGYFVSKDEYLNFMHSETVDFKRLVAVLNELRIIYRLYDISADIIRKYNIEQTASDFQHFTKKELVKNIDELKAEIGNIITKIQKEYNNSFDIDDDEEYEKVQRNMREKKKHFKIFEKLFNSYAEATDNYIPVKAEEKSEQIINSSSSLNEKNFTDWLISDEKFSEAAAKKCISDIHSIEKLYQTLFSVRKSFFDSESVSSIKAMIETLVQKNEYIDANARRNNSFSKSLNKLAKFLDLSIDGLELQPDRNNIRTVDSSSEYVVKTVDFDNPYDCTSYKPSLLVLNDIPHNVNSWKELYTKFLLLLYPDSVYSAILKDNINKPLIGRSICFADKTLKHYLRSPIRISSDFFAEGNLSAVNIIKRIKLIMDLCSIEGNQVVIEYNIHENPIDSSSDDNEFGILSDDSFNPNTSAPFILKNAMIEIMSSNAPEIKSRREYEYGISPVRLHELIKKYYKKNVAVVKILKLFTWDKTTFKSIGKGCYILNPESISEPPANNTVLDMIIENQENEESSANTLTADIILDVIKHNADNLQYTDGFSAYEVKILLANKGISDISESDIEALMSECTELKEIEDGYYLLADTDDSFKITETEQAEIIKAEEPSEEKATEESVPEPRRIVLSINGNTVRAYDYSDALNKVCEFATNCRPFKMARIAGQGIQINGKNVFYRRTVPVDGYNKLLNGLQIIKIDNISDLRTITAEIKKYCQIDDDTIAIFSK
ncbi:MAG: HIRAN domain-containing protein [Lachnospiraceae bacterium]|nr:HIRAN domain-containing protein [Lachnospiraceae bacterium]MCM1230848.1 HIRAN domain-containing protein [Ruminococcus flavefaciens]